MNKTIIVRRAHRLEKHGLNVKDALIVERVCKICNSLKKNIRKI